MILDRQTHLSIVVPGIDTGKLSFLTDVIIVNCGGTINMGTSEGKGPAGAVEKKLTDLKGELLELGIGIQTFTFFERPPDSSNIGEVEWKRIIEEISTINREKQEIKRLLLEKGIQLETGGIVITHGTDTLQITALISALEFSIHPLVAPIIFTGSHSPIGTMGSDGIPNIRKAIYIAKERFSSDSVLPPAVYVLIGQDVHLASRLTKVRTMPDSDGRYFFSFPAPVGRITGDRFHLRIDKAYISRILPSQSIHLRDRVRRAFGIVEHIILGKFSNPGCLDDFKRRVSLYLSELEIEERGIALVIQGDFSANTAFSVLAEKLLQISENLPIFIGSKRAFDRLSLNDKSRIALLPKSMTHTRAQAKLRWLLSFKGVESDLKVLLGENFAGEIFDTSELPEWINYETFPNNQIGTEVIVAYPNMHWKVADDAISRLRSAPVSSKTFYIYGFGDGHVPAVNMPISEMVREHMRREYLGEPGFKPEECLAQIVLGVSRHFSEYDARKLEDYLTRRYELDEKALRSALFKECVKILELHEVEKLKTAIGNLVKKSTRRGIAEVRLRNPSLALIAIMQQMRIAVSPDEIKKQLSGLELNDWNSNLIRQLQNRFPTLLALRVIKDSIMAADRLLGTIGRAVDDHIDVRIKSLAVKSKSNTLNYETGNLLMILGVHSDQTPGWGTSYFRPRY